MRKKLFLTISLLTFLTSALANAPIGVMNNCAPGDPLDISIQGIGLSCIYATAPVLLSNNPGTNTMAIATKDGCDNYTILGIGQVYKVKAGAMVYIEQDGTHNWCICKKGCE